LLSLLFYGRLAVLVARLRTFQRGMLREQEKWAKEEPGDQQPLLEVLRTQTLQVTERARLIRRALLFFLAAVGLLIVCSLTLVTSWFFPPAAFLAAVLFVAGLLSMLGGVIFAMMELSPHFPTRGRIPRKSSPTHLRSKVHAGSDDVAATRGVRLSPAAGFKKRKIVALARIVISEAASVA